MQLVINNFGAYLRKHHDMFLIMIDEKNVEVPVIKVDNIWISTSALVSTDAIQCAMKNNIDIVFLDKYGDPYARIWHPNLGSTPLIRRRQLEASTNDKGLDLIKEWTEKKLKNQINLLKKLKKTRPVQQKQIASVIEQIQKYTQQICKLEGKIDENRQKILGLEGISSRIYFETLSSTLSQKWKFNGRSRRPAKDPFNCTLNYGYGVLYSIVERTCILAGLDPYVGFLHTDDYNKKSFVFDIIEQYRSHVDEIVLFLFTRKMVNDNCFDHVEGGCVLNDNGKKILMTTLNDHFDTQVMYQRKKTKMRNIIQSNCYCIANELTGT
ncbi:MAG: CRISPR-associated endonuclease Cas1 [Candidatus Bathyarchaeota archaeon]|nr:CRISPR-associated endonuclease Cas1 [Candidatus Bathyarchaeota archaeon]